MSAIDSNVISASAVKDRMISKRVSGLGCLAAINARVAISSRRMFWTAAVDRVVASIRERVCIIYGTY